jgi:uncharacterized membrane protein
MGILELLKTWADHVSERWIGASPAGQGGKIPTLGEHLAKTALDEGGKFRGTGPLSEDKLSSAVAKLITVLLDRKQLVEAPLVKPLLDALLAFRKEKLGLTPGGPETAEGRLDTAMTMASAIGLNAHVLSMLLSADFLGCLDLNATGLAAMMGEASGFGELMACVNRPLWEGYLGVPWRENLAEKLRPWRPDLRDLAEWRRHREEWGGWPSGKVPSPLETRLERKGMRQEDIRSWHNALWDWPAARQLLTFLDDPSVWAAPNVTKDLVDHLGYTDAVSAFVLDAMKVRQAGGWIKTLIGLWLDELERGMIDYPAFSDRIKATSMPEHVQTAVLRVGEATWEIAWGKDIIETAKLRYSRDEITEGEFNNIVQTIILDSATADRLVASETLKRMHKVWILSDIEVARNALSVYRQMYVYGLIGEAQYRAALADAQLEPAMIDQRVALDSHRRDQTVAAELREWNLPALRDDLLEGRIGLAAYRGKLAALDFPAALLDAEVAWADVLLRRHLTQRVERYQIPSAERAYVKSLLAKAGLKRFYEEAGRSGDEITIRLKLLDRLRAEEGAAGAAGGGSPSLAVAQAEWKYIDSLITADALVEIYRRLGVAPDRAEARLKVLTPLRL